MSGPLANIAATTIPQFMKGAIDATFRKYKWLAMLKALGRVTYNNSGTRIERVVKYRQNQLRQYEDGSGINFARQARHKRAIQRWASYIMPESISRTDQLMNRGMEALVDIFANKLDTLNKEFTDQFHSQLYADGNASGFENALDGLETFMSISGAATNGFVGTPNDTYAGISTALGASGGNWTTSSSVTTWPLNSGDPQYDFWSPIVALYDATGYDISTATWGARAEEVVRFCVTHTDRNSAADGKPNMVNFNPEMYRKLKNLVAGKERITVSRGEGVSLVSLGFRDSIDIDGSECTSEFGIPSNTGYGMNLAKAELKSMNAELFDFRGPTFHEDHDADLFFMCFNGQMIFDTPRDQFKIRNTAGT